jgi:signal transduction histidine kinase
MPSELNIRSTDKTPATPTGFSITGGDRAAYTHSPVPAAANDESPPPVTQVDLSLLEALGSVEGGTISVLEMPSRRLRFATMRIKELLGLPPERVVGESVDPTAPESDLFRQVIHKADRASVSRHLDELGRANDGTVSTLVLRVRHEDGRWLWVESRSRVLERHPDGKVRSVIGVTVDVTQQRRLGRYLHGALLDLLHAEEKERRRIARELHDSTSQHLVALDLGLSRLDSLAREEVAKLQALQTRIEEFQALTQTAQEELRVLTFAMHPPELEKAGLPATLEALAEGFGRRTGLKVTFKLTGTIKPLAPVVELALLRVSQEALLNVYRHAHANRVAVRLMFKRDSIVLEIEDDGATGVAGTKAKSAGVGLASMRTRVSAIGGSLSLMRSPTGFQVRVRVSNPAVAAEGEEE